MDTTHESTPTEATLRDRFRHLREPWRSVWAGMAAGPIGAVLGIGVGLMRHAVDPCEGFDCLWPLAVVYLAALVVGAWLAVAGLVALAERLDVPARPLERTVQVLALLTWMALAVILGMMAAGW